VLSPFFATFLGAQKSSGKNGAPETPVLPV